MDLEFTDDIRLLTNPRFRRLLEARVIGQTAQNAMLYALFILVVNETGSSVQSTILVMAFALPSILLGIPAGAVADMLPRRFTLTAGYLLRAVIVGSLVFYSESTLDIFLLAAAFSTVGQFFAPAEAAVVPVLVRRDQLPAANALMVLTLIMGQIAGMVVLAPLLLKLIDARSVFVASTVLLLWATYIIGWMASGFTRGEEARARSPGFTESMSEGFRILRSDRHAYLAIVYLVTSLSLLKVLVILLPKYTEDVLKISTEDTVYVAAPAAIGAALGLALAPPLSRWLGAWRVVAFGFALFLLGLVGMGLVVYVRDFIQSNLDFGISFVEDEVGVSSVITVSMLLALPLGLAFSLVSVAARVVMNERARPEVQGRVFAVQMALGEVLSLLPLLLVGIVADVVGVRATLLASALSAIAAAGYLTFSRRFGPPAGTPAGMGPPPEASVAPGG
ncbi:MAG TPA: MFS transporter [Dehalococcoidia bacterium]|nr:MFS transporter [Dehalococcoidia bacterium]